MGGARLFAELEYPRDSEVPSQMEMNGEHEEFEEGLATEKLRQSIVLLDQYCSNLC